MSNNSIPAQIGGASADLWKTAFKTVGLGFALLAASIVAFVTGVSPKLAQQERDIITLQRQMEAVERQNGRIEGKVDRLLEK